MEKPIIKATVKSCADAATDILGVILQDDTTYDKNEIIMGIKVNIMKGLINEGLIDSSIPGILNDIPDNEFLTMYNTPDGIAVDIITNYIVVCLAMNGIHAIDMYDTVNEVISQTSYKIHNF